jgi:environmental stress-induced protein Ves
MTWRVLRPADYTRMPWKNGGGTTTQLAVYPSDLPDTFEWRISIADIETNGPFSTFAGYDRFIALLEGVGMELRFDDTESVRLERRLQFVKFAGERRTEGVLISGKVRDFNVICKRDAVNAEVLHRPLVGPMVFFRDATWFIYVADGSAVAKSGDDTCTLETGASLLLHASADAQRVVLNGGGEVVLVKFATRVAMAAEA